MTEFPHTGEEKKKFVRKMFDDITHRYDFLNHLLSGGIDIYWRKKLVKALPEHLPYPVLDVATGTGDVGFAILKKHPDAQVVGLDYSFNMTCRCLEKIRDKGVQGFSVLQGDGEQLPFADNTFSALTTAFGFRNIGHYEKALNEFIRVLTPGGKLLILEFADPEAGILSAFFRFYFKQILPRIAAFFARSDAYRYLPESVENFPNRNLLTELLTTAGFKNIQINNLTLGISTLVTANKRSS